MKFDIKDTGVGINKNDMNKLFKMFAMFSKYEGKLNQYGNGIGLSISKKIVESLGGQINASSEEGCWSLFTFTVKDMSNNQAVENFNINEQEYFKVKSYFHID